MGPQTEGLVISLGGGLLWTAAFGFVFAVVLILLIRRRPPTPEKVANTSKGGESVAIHGTENHAARSIPAENVVPVAPAETEAHNRGGGVLEEATSGRVEAAGIAFEEMHQDGATAVSAAEGAPQTDDDMAVLPPVGERIPALAPTKEKEEFNPDNSMVGQGDSGGGTISQVGEMAEANEEERSEPRRSGDVAVPAAQIDEALSSGHGEQAEVGEAGKELETEEIVQESEPTDVESENGSGEERAPGRYRAPVPGPGKAARRKASRSGVRGQDREQPLELCVRAVSDRHGFCRFQIVARRPKGGPSEMQAHGGRRMVPLSEVADDWYEISELNDLPSVMERGLRFSVSTEEVGDVSWELRGRDLYVLAELQGLFGFVSAARLLIGEKQIVICRENRSTEVQTILAEARCDGVQVRGRDYGAPSGWVFFGPVSPSRSVPQVPGDDILNLIRPIPDIEIRFEGGLWLRGSSWFAGYPPKLHIAGEMPPGTQVMIDGEAAEERAGMVYVTGSSERPGIHTVWCAGKSASYDIREPDVRWEEWTPDDFSRRVCGAAVGGAGSTHENLASVPTSNPVLIGANPGEVFRCDRRPGRQWTGLVPFAVCWALPEDALHCDRTLRRVLLVKPLPPVPSVVWRYRKKSASASILQWCHAIRDCQRKGLSVSPGDAASEQLWREYEREARAVWRASR